jgi:hypothetical protein
VPSAETHIPTSAAAAYLARLCGHLSKISAPGRLSGHGPRLHGGAGQPPLVLHAEHTQDTGAITLTWGQLTLHAASDALTVRADADSPENLQRIQDMVTARLRKFGRREQLVIQWHPVTDTADGSQEAGQPAAG